MRDMIPKTLPTNELSSFEYGVLAGQQLMLNKVLVITQTEETDTNIEKDK